MSARLSINEDGGYHLAFHDEFSLRDGIARIAHLTGWEVDTEYAISGWGRPDIYIRCTELSIAVEVKTELDTPSKCRKAIQQAANYRVAMPEVSDAYLVAGHINREAMGPYQEAYPQVKVSTALEFLGSLSGLAKGMRNRHQVALSRFQEAERQLEIHRLALTDLSMHEDSPIGVNITQSTTIEGAGAFEQMIQEFAE